jgi:hypothetical protein
MKRLIVYLFIFFGFGLTFSVNSHSSVYCVDNKINERIENFKPDYLKRENEFFYFSAQSGACIGSYTQVTYEQYNYFKNLFSKEKLKIAKTEPSQTQDLVKIKNIEIANTAWILDSRFYVLFLNNGKCKINERGLDTIINNISYEGSWETFCKYKKNYDNSYELEHGNGTKLKKYFLAFFENTFIGSNAEFGLKGFQEVLNGKKPKNIYVQGIKKELTASQIAELPNQESNQTQNLVKKEQTDNDYCLIESTTYQTSYIVFKMNNDSICSGSIIENKLENGILLYNYLSNVITSSGVHLINKKELESFFKPKEKVQVANVESVKDNLKSQDNSIDNEMKFCLKESRLSTFGHVVTEYKENSICEGKDFIVTENSNKALYWYLKTQYKSNNGIFYIKPLILANYKTKTDLTSESKKTEVAKVEEPKQEEFKPEKMKFCVKESMISYLGSLVTDYKENSICEGEDFIVTENSNKALYLYLKTQYKSNNGIFYIIPLILANYKTKTDITNDSKKTEVAKVEEPKKEEFKPKSTNQDKDPPVIQISETITVNNSDYSIEGKVSDKADRVFIEIDGQTIVADKGKFKIQRFSPIDEQIQIVAIDQWGNRSKPKTVNIKLDIKSTETALLIEKLNPTKIKNRTDNNKVALIIGIENYDQTPKATFANLDAKYFYEYANKSFGVPKGNIKLLVDDDANLIQSLGVLSKWLPGKIKNGKTDLIIFFAGHGLASVDGKELFLLPQDSDPDLLERTALSRNELFKNIIDLNPKSVTMFFDTCFSGISRDEKTLLASARPIRIAADEQEGIPENFTIFSASQLDQISSGLKEVNHGIFSYYVMKGLEGNADQNDDKEITNGELLSYLDENVSQKASELGRQQNPTLSGNPDQILARY